MKTLFAVALATVVATSASAQYRPTSPQPGPMQGLPPNAKVTKTTQTFNFAPLKRGFDVPYERIPLVLADIDNSVKFDPKPAPTNNGVKAIVADAGKALPAFGKPTKMDVQGFKGSGNGVIVALYYSKKLPTDARATLNKLFFGKPEDKNAPQNVEFAVTDNVIVIWNFPRHENQAKMASQQKFFDLVSQVASEQQNKK
jgi:hypothetical protein